MTSAPWGDGEKMSEKSCSKVERGTKEKNKLERFWGRTGRICFCGGGAFSLRGALSLDSLLYEKEAGRFVSCSCFAHTIPSAMNTACCARRAWDEDASARLV